MIDLLSRRRAMMVQASGGGLPAGYTQLEYVSGAVRNIDTGIAANGSQWQVVVQVATLPSSTQVVICTDPAGGHFGGFIGSPKKWGVGDNLYFSNDVTNKSTIDFEFTAKGIKATLDGVTKSREGSSAHSTSVHFFAASSNGYTYTQRLYSATCVNGGSFVGIPAERDNDHHTGLYDTANNVFYDLT